MTSFSPARHPIATLISTLLKTITNSCFQALEGLKFQALEGLKSNAQPDESNYCTLSIK